MVDEGTDTWLGEQAQTLQPHIILLGSSQSASTGTYPNTLVNHVGQIYSTPAMLYTAETNLAATGTNYLGPTVTMGNVNATSILVQDGLVGAPTIGFTNQINTGFYRRSTSIVDLVLNGVAAFDFGASNFELQAGCPITWSATNNAAAANDTCLSRISAGLLGIGASTAAGSYDGALKLTTLTSVGVTTTAGRVVAFVSKSANYNLAATDYEVSFTATATANLPAAPTTGTTYRIKNNGNGITVTIQPISGGALIDGNANVQITQQYQSVDLTFDGTNWEIF
jgi:hypothetical protein